MPATGLAVGRGVDGVAGSTYSDSLVAGESAGEPLAFPASGPEAGEAAGGVGDAEAGGAAVGLLVSDSGLGVGCIGCGGCFGCCDFGS
ncbi:hypothetical protein UC34_18750 [Pandoraea vervacti]|uniref:Uncharacterized protein n=1 Tax=Pandoraea vervacti TaxID=656178 RepID=A0ABM5T174_9BURK|nr:hypothetical protein UC34_18750 [Pandoraea vervacti]